MTESWGTSECISHGEDGIEWWQKLEPGMRQDIVAFAVIGLGVLCERNLRDALTTPPPGGSSCP